MQIDFKFDLTADTSFASQLLHPGYHLQPHNLHTLSLYISFSTDKKSLIDHQSFQG